MLSQAKLELIAFYKTQGLEGKELAAAVRKDMRRVKANADRYNPTRDKSEDNSLSLSALFVWKDTKQGMDYWAMRCWLGWQPEKKEQ